MQYRSLSIFALTVILKLSHAEADKRQTSQLQSCPGVINFESSSTVCCVGGSLSLAPLSLSSCAGWPSCTGPVTISSSSTPQNPPLTCAAILNINDPSYSSRLAAATSSIAASGTSAVTTINPTGAAASPGSSASSSRSASASSTRATASSTSSAAKNGADILEAPESAIYALLLAGAIGAAGLVL